MYTEDRKVVASYSQSVNQYILNIQAVYKNSPVPVCVRNQRRLILYANGAFVELFSKGDSPVSGESYTCHHVEISLSSFELECFSMGHGASFCKRFNFHGNVYQVRMENVTFDNNDMVVLWQINLFPDCSLFFNQNKMFCFDGCKINQILNGMSTKTLIVFCLYILGFSHSFISESLGITERASRDRIKFTKEKIRKEFGGIDKFRISCISKEKMASIVEVIRDFIGC